MVLRTFAWICVMVMMASCVAQEAFGHAFLDQSTPAVGATVSAAPAAVTIVFTDDIDAAKSDIQVTDADGKRVDKEDSHAEGDKKDTLVVTLSALVPGTYKVSWHATCVCGHKTEGSFEFTVKGK